MIYLVLIELISLPDSKGLVVGAAYQVLVGGVPNQIMHHIFMSSQCRLKLLCNQIIVLN